MSQEITATVSDRVVVGIEDVADVKAVVLGVQIPHTDAWVIYQAEPDKALEIAHQLTERAEEIKNGAQ